MPNPQNPELRRSEESLRPRPELGPDPQDVSGDGGPIPAENQPGHHPDEEQDKPPADKFAEALGIKPDTEVDSEAEARKATRSARTSKKAAARKAPARKAAGRPAAKAAGGTAAARSRSASGGDSDRGEGGSRGTRPATETPISPAAEPATAAATGTPGAETATASAVASAARRDEPADQAARQHHHELPDEDLPHDSGLVTPSGTPITLKILRWPLKPWGTVLKTSGGLIAAYGNALRKAGERITSGRS